MLLRTDRPFGASKVTVSLGDSWIGDVEVMGAGGGYGDTGDGDVCSGLGGT